MSEYRREVRYVSREARWTFSKLLVLLAALACIGVPFGLFLRGCAVAGSMADQAQQVITEKFGPKEQFAHYEWFKDAAAQLDAKLANLKVYEARLAKLEAAYAGQPRGKWARDDREQWSIWQAERSGVAASFNDLAGQYNAAMAKVNFKYANVGNLPAGATVALPREVKPYVEQ